MSAILSESARAAPRRSIAALFSHWGDVRADVLFQGDSLGPPVGRHQRDPLRDGALGGKRGRRAVGKGDRAAGRGAHAEQEVEHGRDAGPFEPRQPHDFTGVGGEGDVLDLVGHRDFVQRKRGVTPATFALGVAHLGARGSKHVGDHFDDLRILDGRLGNPGAVAQHGDAVAKREDFLETMGNKQDGDALSAEVAHHGEKSLGLARVERRIRFVQYEKACVGQQRLGDLDHLLLPEAERAHQVARLDIESQLGEDRRRALRHGPAVDQAVAHRFVQQEQVGQDIEIGKQAQFLERDGAAFEIHASPAEAQRAAVGALHAC